jgi:hypothetical protein
VTPLSKKDNLLPRCSPLSIFVLCYLSPINDSLSYLSPHHLCTQPLAFPGVLLTVYLHAKFHDAVVEWVVADVSEERSTFVFKCHAVQEIWDLGFTAVQFSVFLYLVSYNVWNEC